MSTASGDGRHRRCHPRSRERHSIELRLAACVIGALVALPGIGGASQAGAPQRPALAARHAESPPVIDGKLDESVWAAAEASDAFVQVEPREGELPTERTEIRALFDADHLYLAIHCFDREPSAIIGTQMKRDADLDTDDRVLIVLDTFEDHRNGYLFEMNPVGAKLDALIASNGEDVNEAWDAIWEGRAAIDGEGWSVELALPFKSLSFRPELTSWGVNVQRVLKRRLEPQLEEVFEPPHKPAVAAE